VVVAVTVVEERVGIGARAVAVAAVVMYVLVSSDGTKAATHKPHFSQLNDSRVHNKML
jgi:hypothetical protein